MPIKASVVRDFCRRLDWIEFIQDVAFDFGPDLLLFGGDIHCFAGIGVKVEEARLMREIACMRRVEWRHSDFEVLTDSGECFQHFIASHIVASQMRTPGALELSLLPPLRCGPDSSDVSEGFRDSGLVPLPLEIFNVRRFIVTCRNVVMGLVSPLPLARHVFIFAHNRRKTGSVLRVLSVISQKNFSPE